MIDGCGWSRSHRLHSGDTASLLHLSIHLWTRKWLELIQESIPVNIYSFTYHFKKWGLKHVTLVPGRSQQVRSKWRSVTRRYCVDDTLKLFCHTWRIAILVCSWPVLNPPFWSGLKYLNNYLVDFILNVNIHKRGNLMTLLQLPL